MGSTGKRYNQEFKDSAIQLALNSASTIVQISKDLNISDKTLYAWVREYKKRHLLDNGAETQRSKSKASKESLEEENRRLRKENASLKKDSEILKKAAAYFAKETL